MAEWQLVHRVMRLSSLSSRDGSESAGDELPGLSLIRRTGIATRRAAARAGVALHNPVSRA